MKLNPFTLGILLAFSALAATPRLAYAQQGAKPNAPPPPAEKATGELNEHTNRLLAMLDSHLGQAMPHIESVLDELGTEPGRFGRQLRSLADTLPLRGGSFEMNAPLEKGNPYSARELREFKQTLGDGNVISRSTTRMLARDSEGRTRQELRQADGSARVFINDPVARLAYIVDPQKKTLCKASFDGRAIFDCFERMKADWKPLGFSFNANSREGMGMMGFSGSSGLASNAFSQLLPFIGGAGSGADVRVSMHSSARGSSGPVGAGYEGAKQTSERSTQSYEGLSVEATKNSETIPAGAIGNARPIEAFRERYFSPELKMTVYSRSVDPRSGEQLYKLSDIKRTEPDASGFKPPAGFIELEGKGR